MRIRRIHAIEIARQREGDTTPKPNGQESGSRCSSVGFCAEGYREVAPSRGVASPLNCKMAGKNFLQNHLFIKFLLAMVDKYSIILVYHTN